MISHIQPLNKTTLSLFFLIFTLVSSAQVASNFTSSSATTDGWVYFDPGSGGNSTPAYSTTGGNPTGNISFTTTSLQVGFYWIAPAKFLGNMSRAYNQNLTLDLIQSIAGSDNNADDIIISNGGTSVVYQLPAKPGTSWTSYPIQFNEAIAGWHFGNRSGLAPTKEQMKLVLSNITSFKIRAKYYGAAGTYTAQLDNVTLNLSAIGTPPTITSFTPTSGIPGTTVIITGTNFSSTPSQNVVYFSNVKATVTNATATQLTVTVPTSAPFGKITIANTATLLQATSLQNFNPLFNNNQDFGGRIIPSSLTTGYSTLLPMSNTDNGGGAIDKGDLDGDGWVDLVVTETGTAKIFAYRNLGTGGVASAASFSSQITLPSLSLIPGGSPALAQIAINDFDSDGKLDIVAACASNGSGAGTFAVYRNTSTSGTISFASPLFFGYSLNAKLIMTVSDLDGDGRLDLIGAYGTSGSYIYVCQNLSTPGNIDFCYGLTLGGAVASVLSIDAGDLDGDSKPEIVVWGYNNTNIQIYKNISTIGAIAINAPFIVTAGTGSTIGGIYISDLDGDGKSDLSYACYASSNLFIKKNNYASGALDATAFGPDLVFTSLLDHPTDLSAGDINADGKPDVVVTGGSDLAIFQNIGSGNLSSSYFSTGVMFKGSVGGNLDYFLGPVIVDLDGDNKPEVAIVYSNNGSPLAEKGVYIFHNENFQPPQITALNPLSTSSGSTITVTGNYLNTKNTIPKMSGIGIAMTPSNVSNTSLKINVPTGFADNRVSATLHGLQAFSPTQFYTQLNGGSGGAINASAFAGSVDYNLSTTISNPGLTVADFDGDGKPDIIVDDNGTGKIYTNTLSAPGANIISGTFTPSASTLSGASNLKAADLDGDGILDVVANGLIFAGMGVSPSPISFSVSSPTSMSNTNRILVNHDFNLDGKPEIAVSNTSSQVLVSENFATPGTPFIYSGGLESFSTNPLTYTNPGTVVGLTAGDFDGDGFEDIAYGVSSTTSFLYVLRNTGSKQVMTSSQFAAPVSLTSFANPQHITTADFDGDGKLDLAVGNYSPSAFISVYLNTSTPGNINFARQDFVSPSFANGIEVGDIDGDGKPEIVTINNPSASNGSFSIFRNTSTAGILSFAPVMTYSLATTVPKALALADVNLDNKTDIIISRTGATKATLSIFQNAITFPVISVNTQPGTIAPVCDGATPSFSTAAAGTTNISYQWQVFNSGSGTYSDLTNTGVYSGVSSSTLKINSTGNFGSGTYRCKINGDFAATVYTNTFSLTVNPIPAAPSANDVNFCPPNTALLTASGGNNGQYLWYDQNGLINGQNSNTYTTPSISSTTTYSVAINNGSCISTKTTVKAVAQPVPVAPLASDVNFCSPASVTLSASGGSNGQYLWYDQSGLINGQNNNSYTTPIITSTTTYSLAINNGSCTSTMTTVKAVQSTTSCNPPVITSESLATQIGGKITLNLVPLIKTTGSPLDLTSLRVIVPPSSGAKATIDAAGILTITYTGLAFSGIDNITIKACDQSSNCTQQQFPIEVAGEIEVYNGVSPDGANPKFIIQFIDALPETKNNTVYIFDRWENLVWKGSNYDNSSVVFTGNSDSGTALPSGVYFYKIVFVSGRKTETGFISLRR